MATAQKRASAQYHKRSALESKWPEFIFRFAFIMKSHSLCGRHDWVHNYWSCKLWTFDLNNIHMNVIRCRWGSMRIQQQKNISLSHDAQCAHHILYLFLFACVFFSQLCSSISLQCLVYFMFICLFDSNFYRHFVIPSIIYVLKNENDDTHCISVVFCCDFPIRLTFNMHTLNHTTDRNHIVCVYVFLSATKGAYWTWDEM